jgi:hypothetical protein
MPKSRIDPTIVFAAGMTGGTLFAMAVSILMGRLGIDLFGVWRTLFATSHAQLRWALAWWAIAGAAFIGGFAITFAMSRFEWLFLRALRVVLLGAVILALAYVARMAPTAEGIVPTAYVAAHAAATVLAAAMAAAGAVFGLRR